MDNNSTSLFNKYEAAINKVASLEALIVKRDRENEFLEAQVEHLSEVVREFKRLNFGPRTEKFYSDEQLTFNEAEVGACDKPEDLKDEATTVAAHTKKKKRGKRNLLPDHLEREVVVIEVPEDERFDEEGNPLKVIGKEVSEKLKYEPAKMSVLQYHRLKYGHDNGDYVKTAKPEANIIPKGIATPSLLAAIITSKYGDGLPLYRQEEIFGRSKVSLSRQTMCRWILKAHDACVGIKNLLEEQLMESRVLACDETYTQVLKEKDKRAESKSRMWARTNPTDQHRIVLFDYDPHRTAEVATKLLQDYEGFLQVDGLASYNQVSRNKNIIRIGCNMHGRRKFEAALTVGANKGKSLAKEGLRFYQKIYDQEDEFRELNLTDDERYERRQKESLPIWNKFKQWANRNKGKAPPQSKIGTAFTYFLNNYEDLVGYLKAGFLLPDNGEVERQIKYFAIGRKNWLFSDTEHGAEASSFFYSLVVTMRANKVEPYAALTYILGAIARDDGLESLEKIVGIILGKTKIPVKKS